LSAAGVPTRINLPAVGTNLQDHGLTVQLYEMAPDVNETSVDSSNAPAAGAVCFPNLYQLFGLERAQTVASQLKSTIADRARALVASGAFSSQRGAEKMLKYQADSLIDAKGW
jgi:hypothetical protein